MLGHIFKKTIIYHIYLYVRIRVRRRLAIHKGGIASECGILLNVGKCTTFMKNVILDGWYERPERQLCDKYLEKSDKIVELGSAIGFLALYCRLRLGIQEFGMVEANPKTIEILKENFKLNHLVPNVLHVAVAREDGVKYLNISGEFWANSLVSPQSHGQENLLAVRTITLPNLLREVGFIPNVLIIDIEGSEKDIDPESIPSEIEAIIIEIHPFSIGIQEAQHLLARFDYCGFRAVDLLEGTYCLLRGQRLKDHSERVSRSMSK
jgi:FkbM family methyltransferase